MSLTDLEQRITALAQSVATAQGLELVEVTINQYKQDTTIQILADKIQENLSMEACAALNRSIVEAIDKEGILSEDGYSLEVASPGLDRPLLTYRDFFRNVGAEIQLWLKEKIAGKSEHKGIIKSASEENLVLLTTKEKKEIIVPISLVEKGLLVI